MIEIKVGEKINDGNFIVQCKSCSKIKTHICRRCVFDYFYRLKIKSIMDYCDICSGCDRSDNTDVYFVKL